MAVWGNHSPTMFADWRFANVEGKSISRLINDEAWYRKMLIPAVEDRRRNN
jgi:malate dehydrogenase